jgi:GNAT superfamily N-acetyltransferase
VLATLQFRGVALKRMVTDGIQYISNYLNVFEKYGVTEFLSAFGLYVHPDFRGQGLGTEILRTRANISKALGLKVTVSFFTTFQGQQSAQKAGMELLAEIPYSVFKTEDGKEVYTNMNPKTLKIMAMRID